MVSTPIGNLEDITLRALRVLQEVDLIAAEDTRRTAKLLSHYNIQKQTVSYHDYNKARRTPDLLRKLRSGVQIAVVSDAGTPGISDPCYYLVRRAIDAGISVIPIPGPTAAISAVVVSGLPTDRFVFEGFLPKAEGRCRTRLFELSTERRTVILYESPHRLVKHLRMMLEVWGDRKMVLARELTKRFEDVQRSTISRFVEQYQDVRPKGEFVLIIEGASEEREKKRRCCPKS
ncbi:MAG: 16S rRNA (cytidine(1402)-2'-O)-methyltransferase [Gemmatimonadota bacterium]|nr:MAG: 16S rRNA (cytidine(1402)-2'-O)-methyltransferase [Gemmatimonadota bacterium]